MSTHIVRVQDLRPGDRLASGITITSPCIRLAKGGREFMARNPNGSERTIILDARRRLEVERHDGCTSLVCHPIPRPEP